MRAELVAAVLKEGGLLDPVSNPGAATPQGLHELYRGRATTTANPYLLRQANCQRTLTTNSVVQERHYTPPGLQQTCQRGVRPTSLTPCTPSTQSTTATVAAAHAAHAVHATRSVAFSGSDAAGFAGSVWSTTSRNTPLRVLNEGATRSTVPRTQQQLGITLHSLNFRASSR